MNFTQNIFLLSLHLVCCLNLKAQSDPKDSLIWVISPVSEIYQGQPVELNSYFFNQSGEQVSLKGVNYEINQGTVKLLKKGKSLLVTPQENKPLIIKAIYNKQVIAESVLKLKRSPSVFLADASGNPIEEAAEEPDFLQVLVSDKDAKNYQVNKVTLRLFRGGKAIAKKDFDSHILDLRDLNLQPQDGIQLKIEKISYKKKEIEPIKLSSRLIAFFITEKK